MTQAVAEPSPIDRKPSTPSVARGAALNLFGAAVFGLSGFVFALVLSNRTGPELAGRFWIGLAVFNITSRICELGTASGLVHGIARARSSEQPHEYSTIVRVALGPVVVAGAIGAAMAAALSFTVFADGGEPDRVVLAFAPFVLVAAVYTPLVQGLRGFGSMGANVAIDRIGRGVLLPSSAIITLILTESIALAALAWGVSTLVLGFVAWVVFGRRIEPNPERDVDRPRVRRDFWTFTKPRIAVQVLDVLVLWIDVLLVGVLASPSAAGVYGAVSRFAIIGMFVAEALMKVVGPRTAELIARSDLAGISTLRRESAIANTIVVWPIYLVVIVFAPGLASIFGPEFATGAPTLRILALGLLVSSLFGPVGSILLMSGDSRATLVVAALGFGTNLVLNVALIPLFGIEGAAIAWAATFVVRAVANARACRNAGIDAGLMPAAPIGLGLLVLTGASSLVVRSMIGPELIGAVTAGFVGAVGMAAMLVSLRPLVSR